MRYQIEKREVTTIKNYHGYPGYGKETRWHIICEGKYVKDKENLTTLWFYRKKDAKEYIEKELEVGNYVY